MIEVRIPGKIMLSGEYGVLYGGKAVLMPVPMHLILRESEASRDKNYSPIIQAALNFPIPEIEEYENKHGLPYLTIDDSRFYSLPINGRRHKLGLGLSAAEAVGVVALRLERAGIPWGDNRDKVIKYAFRLHEKAQGGLGSGADIAACAMAEPIIFMRGSENLLIEPLEINLEKHSLCVKLVWTGKPADTRELVRSFEKWLNEFSGSPDYLKKLIAAGDLLAQSWFECPPDLLFNRLDQYAAILREIAELAQIPVFLPIHDELMAWAAENGGRSKPSGAGGGDMAILIGDLPIRNPHETVIPICP